MSLASWWFNTMVEGFLTGEFYLDIGGMILCVTDKDKVRERHFTGAVTVGIASQKYYSPFSETEEDYKAGTGKEIMCYLEVARDGWGQFASSNFKVWVGPTINSKTGARDVFGINLNTGSNFVTTPPFILKAGEYLTLEYVSGLATGIKSTKIIGVERDTT